MLNTINILDLYYYHINSQSLKYFRYYNNIYSITTEIVHYILTFTKYLYR